MKLIIAGSRSIDNMMVLKYAIEDSDLLLNKDTEIVCGMASGIDLLGKEYAEQNGMNVVPFPAVWYSNGKYDHGAGHKRNRQMGDYADSLLAVWDGHSTGTKGMIEYMKQLKKPVHVFVPPTVVNINATNFDVYVGRGTVWGNPFKIDERSGQTRNVVIARYRSYLWNKIQSGEISEKMLLELDGKRLGCHCKPLQCHGDVLQSAVLYFRSRNEKSFSKIL